MFENLNKKQKIIFIFILICMVSIIVYYIYTTVNQYNYETISSDDNLVAQDSSEENTTIEEETQILVHVSGCVENNCVVKLKSGSRIQDAIDAAGGLTENADLTNINLAYILEDGEKIYIPKEGEELDEYSSYISSSEVSGSSTSGSSSSKTQKININKATADELEEIPGIGPSTALKIINYREENGKFNSIEDIKNVSGIGDAKYENMKDYITVK